MVMSTDITNSCIEKELGDICSWWAVCSPSRKILYNIFTIATKRAKVVTLSSRGKGENKIELFD
jgi:hypothetical protein